MSSPESALKRARVQTVEPLTLDKLLAFDTPFFKEEFDRLIRFLSNVVRDDTIIKTVLSIKVLPLCQSLLSWFLIFDDNMRKPTIRLPGSLKARVCFAEQAMSLLMQLADAMKEVKELYFTEKETTDFNIIRRLFQIEETINPKPDKKIGLKFLTIYLSTIIDVVPLKFKSSTTSLTPQNMRNVLETLNSLSE